MIKRVLDVITVHGLPRRLILPHTPVLRMEYCSTVKHYENVDEAFLCVLSGFADVNTFLRVNSINSP